MAFSLRASPRSGTSDSLTPAEPPGQTALAWQAGPVTGITVRDAAAADTEAIGRIAIATGQDEEWGGADPAYVSHLLAHGHLVVAEHRGAVTGFGATVRIGAGPAGATMLSDLFVDPRSHGLGLGQAMLEVLWHDSTARMTFSSLHAHALPLYARYGLDAWWPLLYLSGDVTALPAPAGWAVALASPGEVAGLERRWTGIDRTADHQAWAARPGGRPVLAARDGQAAAAGTVGGAGTEYGIIHLALSPDCGDDDARDAVVAVLASLDPPGGRARVCLPAPHPAVRTLLAARWRNEDMDLYMATEPGLLDPRRTVPSPALA
jgi:GNAT superfamily N-acetyltransferase